MVLWPVIERELRAEARHPITYGLRLLGAGAMLTAALLFSLEHLRPNLGMRPGLGALLFARLHGTLLAAIWIVVPLLTADCISRERREGTLGLLFLTPLRPWQIVTAKSLAHGLRALTLGLAAIPVLTLSFLMGGVGWHEVVLSVLINTSSLCWALTAGVLASSVCVRWTRALWLAALSGAVSFAALCALNVVSFVQVARAYIPGFTGIGYRGWLRIQTFGEAVDLLANGDGSWPEIMQILRPAGSDALLLYSIGLPLSSLLVLGMVVLWAARHVRRHWQEGPASPRQVWWRETFCTPVPLLAFYRPWLRWRLHRNPVGWLEQRTWYGRVAFWVWLAIMGSMWLPVLTSPRFYNGGFGSEERLLLLLLAVSMGLSAVGSFRRERETGLMELLLVTPMSERQIIWGRLWGIWGRFLPAIFLALSLWLYVIARGQGPPSSLPDLAYYAFAFATVPVIGLFFSLRCRNFLIASLLTLFLGLVLPVMLPEVIEVLARISGGQNWTPGRPFVIVFRHGRLLISEAERCGLSFFVQLSVAGFLAWRLHRRLVTRSFGLYGSAT